MMDNSVSPRGFLKTASRALGVTALLALLAASLLFLLPGGPLHAQEAAIQYAENGTGPVATYTAVDPEGTAVKWSLSGVDAGDFSIDGGVLAFKKSPDFEKATGGGSETDNVSNTYLVTVEATDSTRKTAEKPVMVTVTNVDEPGTVKLTTLRPMAGVALTASVTDPDTRVSSVVADVVADSDVTGATWQWAKSQSGTGSWANIDTATGSMYTPADDDAGYYLRATTTYKDKESHRDEKTAQGVSANTVQAARSANKAPKFAEDQDPVMEDDQGVATRKVTENTLAGEAIGDPVVATDGDDDILTYTLTLEEKDDGLFAIDWDTGQLRTKGKLDFEEAGEISTINGVDVTDLTKGYTVVVRATDPDGMPEANPLVIANADTVMVTIIVIDVDEAPDIITGDAAVPFAEDGSIGVALGSSYTANDPETDAVPTFLKAGADSGKFDFMDGALMFKAQPDYETPGDANKDNVYEVTVQAKDGVGNIGMKAVKVTVTNVEEAGTVTLTQLQPRVGVAITASVTDLDGDVSGVTWQWSRSTTEIGNYTAIEKATSATYKPAKPAGDDAGDVDMFLRATATYTDGEGDRLADNSDKTASGTSAKKVAVDTRNRAPVFDDQDDDTDGVQNDETTRKVAENAKADAADGAADNVGNPVTATDPDPNSDALDYTLSGADAGFFSVGPDDPTTDPSDEGGQIKVKSGTKLDYETKQTYNVTLKAADSFGDYDTIMVTIMVTPVNEPPPVMGEATVEYAENGTDPVATYTAEDPEGATVKWSLLVEVGLVDDAGDFSISGGELSFKKSPNYEDATGGGPDDGDVSNTYSVTVVATDATRRASMKAVTVNVTNVDEPGTVKLTTLAPSAGIALTASVSDPDGNESGHVWQWAKSRSRTSGWDDIDKATSAIYTPLDGDAGNYLRATVTYKDRESGRDTKTAVGVSANSVKAKRSKNDAPVFPDQNLDTAQDESETATREVAENTAAGQAIGDPIVAEDGDDVLTYTLYDENGDDSALFAIDWATGQLKTKGKLDFEATNNPVDGYMVRVRATDPDGMPEVATADPENSDVITVIITITDVDEAPAIMGTAAVSFAENGTITTPLATYNANDPETGAGRPTLALTGADKGKFEFDITNGDLEFAAPPDYEKPGDADKDNVYEVTVEATDGVSNTGTKNVRITVTNVEEVGTVTMSQLQPRVGVAITASVTDLDGDVSDVTWQWSSSASDTGEYTDIEKATSASYKPVKVDANPTRMWLRATAMYTDGFGEDESAMGESANSVAVDTRNRAPVFVDQDDDTDGVQNEATTREVGENTNDNVGAPVAATDPDPNDDTLVYALEGADAARFAIHRTTGQIEVGAGTKLDYETKDTYMVTVRVTDSFGDSDTIAVTIMVTDMDEAPEIMRAPEANVAPEFATAMTSRTVAENTAAGEDIGNPVAANDANGDALTYALGGTDAASFDIDTGSGQLMTLAALDYEAKTSYSVTVTASDSGGLSDSIDVSITVTNVDEPGRVTFWRGGADATTAAIMVGDELGGAVDDSDGNPGDTFPIAMYTRIANVTSWQWARSMDMTDWEDIGTDGMYTVIDDDAGYYLRATAMYDDGEGSGKNAMATTGSAVTDVDEADRTRDAIRLEIEEAILDAVLSAGINDAERSAIEQLILEFALTPSS